LDYEESSGPATNANGYDKGSTTLDVSYANKIVYLNFSTAGNVTINTGIFSQGDIIIFKRTNTADGTVVAGSG
jgi:hypothetical protein